MAITSGIVPWLGHSSRVSRHASFSNVSARPLLALLTFALHAVSATPANPTHTHMKQDVLAMLGGEGLHTPWRSTPFVLAAPLLSSPLALQVLREVSFFWPTSHALVRTHALTMPLSLPHIHTTQTPRRRRVVGSRAPEQVSVGASDFFRFSPSSTSPPLPDLGQRARSVRGSVCLRRGRRWTSRRTPRPGQARKCSGRMCACACWACSSPFSAPRCEDGE